MSRLAVCLKSLENYEPSKEAVQRGGLDYQIGVMETENILQDEKRQDCETAGFLPFSQQQKKEKNKTTIYFEHLSFFNLSKAFLESLQQKKTTTIVITFLDFPKNSDS